MGAAASLCYLNSSLVQEREPPKCSTSLRAQHRALNTCWSPGTDQRTEISPLHVVAQSFHPQKKTSLFISGHLLIQTRWAHVSRLGVSESALERLYDDRSEQRNIRNYHADFAITVSSRCRSVYCGSCLPKLSAELAALLCLVYVSCITFCFLDFVLIDRLRQPSWPLAASMTRGVCIPGCGLTPPPRHPLRRWKRWCDESLRPVGCYLFVQLFGSAHFDSHRHVLGCSVFIFAFQSFSAGFRVVYQRCTCPANLQPPQHQTIC